MSDIDVSYENDGVRLKINSARAAAALTRGQSSGRVYIAGETILVTPMSFFKITRARATQDFTWSVVGKENE